MTLFYDQGDKVYMQKQVNIRIKKAVVKTYICDQDGNIIRTIGKTALNFAQYASKEKFGLQVQIEGQDKKLKQQAIITFQINLERQDDDSKSVNTVSEQQFQSKSRQLSELKQGQKRSRSKDKRNFLFPINQSSVSVRSDREKLKHSSVSQVDEKFSQQTKKRGKQNSPIKYLDDVGKDGGKLDSQQEGNNFFNKLQTKQKAAGTNSSNKLQAKQKAAGQQVQYKGESAKKRQNPTKNSAESIQQIRQSMYNQDPQTKNSSSQLRLHLANKKASNLQRQNSQLKSETLRLKSIIQQVLEQKGKRETCQSDNSNQYKQQVEYYRKVIVEKQMKINQLQSLNKLVSQRQEEKDKQIRDFKSQVKEQRLKLQYEKNKLAKVLQTAMQSQNVQLLEILQKELNDQFY